MQRATCLERGLRNTHLSLRKAIHLGCACRTSRAAARGSRQPVATQRVSAASIDAAQVEVQNESSSDDEIDEGVEGNPFEAMGVDRLLLVGVTAAACTSISTAACPGSPRCVPLAHPYHPSPMHNVLHWHGRPQGGLRGMDIRAPAPIQAAAIPAILAGSNCAVQSYTGSGKVRCLHGTPAPTLERTVVPPPC